MILPFTILYFVIALVAYRFMSHICKSKIEAVLWAIFWPIPLITGLFL